MKKYRQIRIPINGLEDVEPIICNTQEEINKATECFLGSKCVVLISRQWDNSYFVEGIPEITRQEMPNV